jgi:hypothetical protein
MMIDWTKLQPHEGDQRKAFEELCYYIASKRHTADGLIIRVDDTGGGDGVEFYLRLQDGSEWGWQAKFYFPDKRLNPTRKRAIEDSLIRATSIHPKLTRWFLCTPTDLTPSENEWYRTTLKAKHPNVTLDHWGASHFNVMLNAPDLNGARSLFFGELELSPAWFQRQVEQQVNNIHNKFIEELHVESETELEVHALAGDDRFVARLFEIHERLISLEQDFISAAFKLPRFTKAERIQRHRNGINSIIKILSGIFADVLKLFAQLIFFLRSSDFENASAVNFHSRLCDLDELLDKYENLQHRAYQQIDSIRTQSQEESVYIALRHRVDNCGSPLRLARNFSTVIQLSLFYLSRFRRQDLCLFGIAGTGKTHLVGNICQTRLREHLPTILLFGHQFRSGEPLEAQFHRLCGVPSRYSWNEFCAILEGYASVHRSRVIIAIDGVNEAESIDIWRRELHGFISSLAHTPRIVLLITCRASYRTAIWGPAGPEVGARVYGFRDTDVDKALTKYFKYYKIHADLTFAPLQQFENPLFLKIFCESQNSSRTTQRTIFLGEQNLFAVFDKFLEQVNGNICEKLEKPPLIALIRPLLEKLAMVLWQDGSRSVSFSAAAKLFDGFLPTDQEFKWSNSITKALLDEEIVLTRDLFLGKDTIFFTYDLLAGYLIASSLLEKQSPNEISAFANSQPFKERLAATTGARMHPLREDIIRCLAALLPKYAGKRLDELSTEPSIFSYSINALFEMDPQWLTRKDLDKLRHLFRISAGNQKSLLSRARATSMVPKHPLNQRFWDPLLRSLLLTQRDLGWTELQRESAYSLERELKGIREKLASTLSQIGSDNVRVGLRIEYLKWLLTSTNRGLRDAVTYTLVILGTSYPKLLFQSTLRSLTINDAYIWERMLAASYGTAMRLRGLVAEKQLEHYAHKLYDSMFAPNARYGTTHIFARDFARQSIELALYVRGNFLTPEERKHLSPPYKYGGTRSWGKSDDRNKDEYSSGNSPFPFDFTYDILPRIMPLEISNDHNIGIPELTANILWRIYDLGYDFKRFGDLDRRIASTSSSGRSHNRTVDTYGNKYVWIAFYELYGHLQDRGIARIRLCESCERVSEIDIDPSFPETPINLQVISSNFLDDSNIDLEAWIKEGGLPNLIPSIIQESINGYRGPWVLLDGYINQENDNTRQARFLFPRGFLIETSSTHKFLERLKFQKLKGRWLPEIPEDY